MLTRLTLLAATVGLLACSGDTAPIDTDTGPAWDCEPDSRTGEAGRTDGVRSASGITYNVRAPDDYDPLVAHPLLMVYAPSGGAPDTTETFTGLTPDATGRGWVTVYADHLTPRSVEDIQPLADIAVEVSETWCIDTERVALTGHSDGGTAATVIAGFDQLPWPPTAIAPSAAGIDTSTLTQFTCPAPLPVMVLHSRNDSLFPVRSGFGRGAAEWWADCNGCTAGPGAPDANGCVAWSGCTDEATVLYCEGAGSHGSWPRLNDEMLDFLEGGD